MSLYCILCQKTSYQLTRSSRHSYYTRDGTI